jgi:hypothetical protein
MRELEYEVFRDEHPIALSLDWLAVNGNLVASSINKQTLTLSDFLKPKLRELDQNQTSERNTALVEAQPNILSKEADKFLNSFFRILKDNLETPPGAQGQKARDNFGRFVKGRHISLTKCWML